jgi:DNA-binding MarR family transcriptional regulator
MLEREVFVALLRAHERLKGEVEALLAVHGISEAQFNALRILRGAGPKGLPTQQIAERLITRQPDVTRLVDRMCAARLAKRVKCKEDRRVVYVVLAPAGLNLLQTLDAPIDDLHRRQFAHMSRARLAELGALLAEVAAGE